MIATITILVAITIPTYGQVPAGQWRLETVYPVYPLSDNPRLPRNAVPGSDVRGWWWLPILNENQLIDQMNRETDYLAKTTYRQPLPHVHFFPGAGGGVTIPTLSTDTTGSARGGPIADVGPSDYRGFASYPGIALIETWRNVIVIGGTSAPGGAAAVMKYIQDNIYYESYNEDWGTWEKIRKPIRWLIIPDVMESSWASAREFYTAATPEHPITVITSAAFAGALASRQAVAPNEWMTSSTGVRRLRVAGGFPDPPAGSGLPRDTDWRVSPPWYDVFGTSPFPTSSSDSIPNVDFRQIPLDSLETLDLDDLHVRFATVLDEIGALAVFLPQFQLLIPPSFFDGHLVNTGPLQWPVVPIRKVIAAVELMKTFDIVPGRNYGGFLRYYLPLRGFFMGIYPDGKSKGPIYLDTTLALLNSIHDQTLAKINEGKSLDDIVAEVTIPDTVRSKCDQIVNPPYLYSSSYPHSPCGEFVNSLASMVKGIYTEYMGWFDGNARSLSAHVTPSDKASLLLDVAGGDMGQLLLVAKKMTDAADTLPSIERALYLIEPLHDWAPSPDVDLMYFKLLWKAGMLQTANDVRNYYLSLAWQHRPANWADFQ